MKQIQDVWQSLAYEQDNFRAALAWSLRREPETALRLTIKLWPYWESRGHSVEGRNWLKAALLANPDAAPALRAKALVGAGKLAWFAGDFAQAREHLQEALKAARAGHDEESLAFALLFLGNLANYRTDYAEAETLLREALAMQRRNNNIEGIATALLHLSHSIQNQLDLVQARDLLDESLALSRTRGVTDVLIITLYFVGDLALLQGDLERARGVFSEGLQLARATTNLVGIAYVLFGLAWVERESGNFAVAYENLREAIGIVRDNGQGWAVPFFLEAFGYLAIAQGQFERGSIILGAAEESRETMPQPMATSYQALHQRYITLALKGLGKARFASTWAQGHTLNSEKALDFALGLETMG
jgi:non-specific serine/threonine protein kinase